MRQAYEAQKVMERVKSINVALRRTAAAAAHRHDGAIGIFIKAIFAVVYIKAIPPLLNKIFIQRLLE